MAIKRSEQVKNKFASFTVIYSHIMTKSIFFIMPLCAGVAAMYAAPHYAIYISPPLSTAHI